jgi:hypothetical protein
MPTQYTSKDLTLSKAQGENVATGVKNKSPVVLRLTKDDVKGSGAKLPLTDRQLKHIERNLKKGMGSQLTLSKAQLRRCRSGGYLPLLIGLGEAAVELAPEILEAAAGIYKAVKTVKTLTKKEKKAVEKESQLPDHGMDRQVKLGTGVGADVVRVTRKVAKQVGRTAAKIACNTAAKTIDSSIGSQVVQEGCKSLVDAVIGEGIPPKRKRKAK